MPATITFVCLTKKNNFHFRYFINIKEYGILNVIVDNVTYKGWKSRKNAHTNNNFNKVSNNVFSV